MLPAIISHLFIRLSGRVPAISLKKIMEEQLMRAREQLRKLMYDDAGQVVRLLTSVEAATGVAREHVALTVVGTLAVYLIVGDRAQLLCNAICFIIPAIISFNALDANDSSKFGRLIVYWTAYAALIIIDLAIVACDGHSCFPFYWLIKTIVLLLLLLFPDGAQRIYDHFVSAAVEGNEPEEAVHQEQPIANEPKPDEAEPAELTTTAEQSSEPDPPSPPALVEMVEELAPVEEQQEDPAPVVEEQQEDPAPVVEEQQEDPTPVIGELTPQPMTEEQRLKAEEAEEIKALMAEEALNEIRLLNRRRNELIKEASVIITPTTNSAQTSNAESATQPSTVEQQQTAAGEHYEESTHALKPQETIVHSVRTTSQPTDGAESNASQSPPPEMPEPYVPTLPTSDSDVSLTTSLYAQHSLNDSSATSAIDPTTAATSAEGSASPSLNQTTVASQAPTDGDDLKLEPNSMLVFNAPFADRTLVYHVRMTNTSSHPIGYAVKSNAIPRLMPDHGFGVLAPGEKVLLAVSSAPFHYHLEDTSKDRLAIEYMTVPVGVHDFGLDWFVHKKGNCVVKRKNLVVQYNA